MYLDVRKSKPSEKIEEDDDDNDEDKNLTRRLHKSCCRAGRGTCHLSCGLGTTPQAFGRLHCRWGVPGSSWLDSIHLDHRLVRPQHSIPVGRDRGGRVHGIGVDTNFNQPYVTTKQI